MTVDRGACFYRIKMPLEELGKHDGFEVTFASVGDQEGHRDPVTASMLEGYDVIVGQRLNKHDGMGVWRRARTPFSRLVYENDDDVWSINKENWQAHSLYAREDIRDAITHGAEVADLITVTTEHLAQVMTEASGNQNVAVLPNHIPGWVLDMPLKPRPRPAIGWQGGASHGADIGLIADPVRRFLKRFPGWDLQLNGTDYRPTFQAAQDRMLYVPWVHVTGDPEGFYAAMDFDIGLAPLLGNEFNSVKSRIKPLR